MRAESPFITCLKSGITLSGCKLFGQTTMALTLNNGTTIFFQLRRGVVTSPNFPSSSKPIHHQTYNFSSRNNTRLFSASANASVVTKTAGHELRQQSETSNPGKFLQLTWLREMLKFFYYYFFFVKTDGEIDNISPVSYVRLGGIYRECLG